MFGSSSKSDDNVDVSNLTSKQRDALIDNVRQQVAVANAQELIQVCGFDLIFCDSFFIQFGFFCSASPINAFASVFKSLAHRWTKVTRFVSGVFISNGRRCRFCLRFSLFARLNNALPYNFLPFCHKS
jgi:hypothetical protein